MNNQKRFCHREMDAVTGEVQSFYPMPIEVNPAASRYDKDGREDADAYEVDKEYLESLRIQTALDMYNNEVTCEIGMTKLGFKNFKAVFVPTSLEEYRELIKDEMNAQETAKQNGRCIIPSKNGGSKVCPRRKPNPDYVEGGEMPKTLPVRCENCPYRDHKNNPTEVSPSDLAVTDSDGEETEYDFVSPYNYYAGDMYERLIDQWGEYVRQHAPELEDLAVLLAMEYQRSEAAREVGIASSTAQSQRDKLKKLVVNFLAEVPSII